MGAEHSSDAGQPRAPADLRAPVPPPGRGEQTSRALVVAWKQKLQPATTSAGRELWPFIEAFGFEMDWYVPAIADPDSGLWPQVLETGGCPFYTRRAGAEKISPQVLLLSGIEAFRWLWAAPSRPERIILDDGNTGGGLEFAATDALPLLFPAAWEYDLRKVAGTGLDKLGLLPGACGLKPAVVRALAMGWKQLFGVKDAAPIEYEGRRYLPVFSSQQSFFAWGANAGSRVLPEPSGGSPPFFAWLQLSSATGGAGREAPLDGVLLDPASPAPLPLEHLDLLVLEHRARAATQQPDHHSLLMAAAKLAAAGTISHHTAGRIAAGFPVYWAGVLSAPQQPGMSLLVYPRTRACCLFTSRGRAEAFCALAREAMRTAGIAGEIRPSARFARWGRHVFQTVLDSFDEARVDPELVDPGKASAEAIESAQGFRLTRAAISSAAARLDEVLQPRVAPASADRLL